ncbi:hypothetical protein KUL42_03520 [Alteromonas sp. KUL42]|uniref:hypothetical protein n=1 Tax=Alteromonas sp. KUL42 TaxID=2480797 RepID=UPI001036E2F4|nr:hypothetical protein [Alteromonas sp. KUL42]TAP38346.1 hypothetical protein EYR97_01740 [Alteromonas sp. KUL42]GEA05591.1 hypothetical protein KUL42_03520 [Alteromonas sp. KUL42]
MSEHAFKLLVQGENIVSVPALRVLRTIMPLRMKESIELALSIKQLGEFVIIEGCSEDIIDDLVEDFAQANVIAQKLPCEYSQARICMPLIGERKRWNALRMLVETSY